MRNGPNFLELRNIIPMQHIIEHRMPQTRKSGRRPQYEVFKHKTSSTRGNAR